jgi:ArsR family metal-binding transcriptional regulator
MKLFELSAQYQQLIEETFDVETGEINEQALANLDQLKVDVKEKSIAIASYIKNIDAEKKAIEEAKKAMAEREARLERRVTSLTSYLKTNMERCGINEISCAYFAIKLKNCPVSVDIQNEDLIPSEFKKTKEVISVDKIKIKEGILAGHEIPGASLKQNTRLEIR